MRLGVSMPIGGLLLLLFGGSYLLCSDLGGGAGRPVAAAQSEAVTSSAPVSSSRTASMVAWSSILATCPLRIEPVSGAATTGSVSEGTRVRVLEVRGGWRRIEDVTGREGWTGPYCWR